MVSHGSLSFVYSFLVDFLNQNKYSIIEKSCNSLLTSSKNAYFPLEPLFINRSKYLFKSNKLNLTEL